MSFLIWNPTDLLGLAPERGVDFAIQVEPGTKPSPFPYTNMAPVELKEFNT